MSIKMIFGLLPFLFLSTFVHAQNKTPLISDMEIAAMIQKELEIFGTDVSTMDAWQMSRRMGITQRFAGEISNRDAEMIHALTKEETYLRIAVSPDWSRFAIGDYFKPVSVWAMGGAEIASFEAGVFARWITFSADGRWLAGDRVLKEDPQLQVVVAAIDSPGEVYVIEKTAIQYGIPGWSPDGRYLAYRAFRGGGKEDLMVVDLTGERPSLTEGGFLLQQ